MAHYLSVADVLALHDAMMRRLGVAPQSLRDASLLESAIMKPQMAVYYEDAELIRQAALLAGGIAQNQPFVDGNKRTAYIAAWVFLERNSRRFTGDGLEFARRLEVLAERDDSPDAATARLEIWLRTNVS